MTVSEPSQVIQPSIPDCGQSNEQSAQGLSWADVCDAGVQQTWDECPECGASSDDLCGKVFSQVVADTDSTAPVDISLVSGASSDPFSSTRKDERA